MWLCCDVLQRGRVGKRQGSEGLQTRANDLLHVMGLLESLLLLAPKSTAELCWQRGNDGGELSVCLLGYLLHQKEKGGMKVDWNKPETLSHANAWRMIVAKKAFDIYSAENGYSMAWEVLTDQGRAAWIEKARIIMAALDVLE
jgi:hypothetical protein